MKNLQGIRAFAHTDELDGNARYPGHRKRGAAPCIAIHFGHDQARQRHSLVKFLGCSHRVLTGHSVDDQKCLVGRCLALDRFQFLHQLIIDVQAAAGVDDNPGHTQLRSALDSVLHHLGDR